MRFENTRVFNFEGAIRGMRNPMESWAKSDSQMCEGYENKGGECVVQPLCETSRFGQCHDGFIMGAKDLELAQRLIRSGSEHRKFMRQIFVSVDITAPLFWWKEADTYAVGVTKNSTSTMHTIQNKPITKELFEIGDYHPELGLIDDVPLGVRVDCFINDLEQLRQLFIMEEDPVIKKRYWKELIRWLPEGWLQTRTVTLNYENLLAMCSPGQRRFHKQTEWSVDFISWARSLPYAEQLIFIDEFDAARELEKSPEEKIRDFAKRARNMAAQNNVEMGDFLHILSEEIMKEAS